MRHQEQQLVEKLKHGDPKAVRQWYAEYYAGLQKYVCKRIDNVKDAEEIVQETFLNALRQLPLFLGQSQLSTWMISIARHEIADFYRKRYAKKAIKTIPLGELLLQSKIEDTHTLASEVKVVLAAMSEESVELLLQKYVDEKKVADLAVERNKSEKSIEAQLYRARKEFKERFEEHYASTGRISQET